MHVEIVKDGQLQHINRGKSPDSDFGGNFQVQAALRRTASKWDLYNLDEYTRPHISAHGSPSIVLRYVVE